MPINKRTSDSKIALAPAALGTPTHFFRAAVHDTNGQVLGHEFNLLMAYDQARNAFVNTEHIEIVAQATQTCSTLLLRNNEAEVARVGLQYHYNVNAGDTISFEPSSVMIEIPRGMHLERPGLYVINEEPSLYD